MTRGRLTVYGDWLLERGDLIALHAGGRDPAFERLLAVHRTHVLGSLAELAPDILARRRRASLGRAHWRAAQALRGPKVNQLDRLVLPLALPSLADVRALLGAFPTAQALRARGFQDGYSRRRSQLSRRYRYRDEIHTVVADTVRHQLGADRELPRVVIHELARDLVW